VIFAQPGAGIQFNRPNSYYFVAYTAGVTITGSLFDEEGYTIGTYSLALPYSADSDVAYNTNKKSLADATVTMATGKTVANVATFSFPVDQASLVKFNIGVKYGLPPTTNDLTIANTIILGGNDA